MDILETITVQQAAIVLALCASGAVAVAIVLLVTAAQQIATIEIPEDADFFETLQYLPITVPLALDLLDMVFDVFAAPISWIILELLGLKSLQMITVFEGVIPGTQLIPTMTGAWVIARLMKNKEPEGSRLRSEIRDYQLRSEDDRYHRLRSGGNDRLREQYRGQALLPPTSSSGRAQSGMPGGIIDGEYEEFIDDMEAPPYYDDYE